MLNDRFAGEVAARYDLTLGAMGSPGVVGPTVDLLAEFAGTGAALEMAVGTGRIALPLAARGVPVSGIELSPDMVAQLRAKPGGDGIPITLGDMTTTRSRGAFRLVYLVFNTIGNVETQDRQVACFENAAAHLEAGGWLRSRAGLRRLRPLRRSRRAARRLPPFLRQWVRCAGGSDTVAVRLALRAGSDGAAGRS